MYPHWYLQNRKLSQFLGTCKDSSPQVFPTVKDHLFLTCFASFIAASFPKQQLNLLFHLHSNFRAKFQFCKDTLQGNTTSLLKGNS